MSGALDYFEKTPILDASKIDSLAFRRLGKNYALGPGLPIKGFAG